MVEQQKEVPGATKEVKELKHELRKIETKAAELPDIIGEHVPRIMRDRTVMKNLEQAVDEYFKSNPGPRTYEEKKAILDTVTTAKQVLESIYVRIQQTLC